MELDFNNWVFSSTVREFQDNARGAAMKLDFSYVIDSKCLWQMNKLRSKPIPRFVHINCNGLGGETAVGQKIIEKMLDWKQKGSTLVGHVQTECYSMHAGILLYCDNLVVPDEAEILFHRIQKYKRGRLKPEFIPPYFNASELCIWRWLTDQVYHLKIKPLLTRYERFKYFLGYDIILTGAQLKERLSEIRRD